MAQFHLSSAVPDIMYPGLRQKLRSSVVKKRMAYEKAKAGSTKPCPRCFRTKPEMPYAKPIGNT